MLVLNLRPCVQYDLHRALARWLDDSEQVVSFEPTNPLQLVLPKPEFSSTQCHEELVRLQSVRNGVSDIISKPHCHQAALSRDTRAARNNGLEDCYEYHAAVLEFEKRGFPTIEDEHSDIQIRWKSAWANTEEKHSTLIWDRVNVMYNVVALLTYRVSSECSYTDRASCKDAVGHCQTAVGILAVLKELVSSQDYSAVDLSQPMLSFWEKYLTAEGQHYVFRMASLNNTDNTKHGMLSFLSQSAYELFNSALSAAQDPRLESEVPRQSSLWGTYCKVLAMLSSAKAEYHQSALHRIANEYGKEIARLRRCLEKLNSCSEFIESLSTEQQENDEHVNVIDHAKRECRAILPVVRDRHAEIDKDNYNIYQDEIPSSMPDVTPKQLVKTAAALPQPMVVPQKALFTNL